MTTKIFRGIDEQEKRRLRNMDKDDLVQELERRHDAHDALRNAAFDKDCPSVLSFEIAAKHEDYKGKSPGELNQELYQIADWLQEGHDIVNKKQFKEDQDRIGNTGMSVSRPAVDAMPAVASPVSAALSESAFGRIINQGLATDDSTGKAVSGVDFLELMRKQAEEGFGQTMSFTINSRLTDILNVTRTRANTMVPDNPLSTHEVVMLDPAVAELASSLPVRTVAGYRSEYKFRRQDTAALGIPNSNDISVAEAGTPQEKVVSNTIHSVTMEKLGMYLKVAEEVFADSQGFMEFASDVIYQTMGSALEYNVVAGAGGTNQWTGINTVTGTLASGARPASNADYHNVQDHLRHNGKFKMYKEGGRMPNVGVFHTDDIDDFLGLVDSQNRPLFAVDIRSGTIPNFWGMRLIASNYLTAKSGLLLYTPKIKILDRQGVRFTVGTDGNDLRDGLRTMVVTSRGNMLVEDLNKVLKMNLATA